MSTARIPDGTPLVLCALGHICGLCFTRRMDAWPPKPLAPSELDRWFGEATGWLKV